ncbi:MAG: alpha-2,3-sialyltransferase [Rhodobacter sp.]|nr:alpha-2,3-sialyltransferase [Rhodobacter sp.]
MSDVTVVAGSGLSLARIAPGRVLAADTMVRVNNFYFEDRYYLGRRVDLAFIGGDPRVTPFMFETLARAHAQYQVRAWSAPTPRIARIGRKFMTAPYRPLRYADDRVGALLHDLRTRYQAQPSSGIQALFLAHALGARHIVLAGIDLYAGPQRYAYAPGRHQRDLLGADLATRSYDLRLHHPDLDRQAIAWLAEQPDVALWRSADCAALNDLLDLAPERPGPAPEAAPKDRILDWADWAGWYPIGLLKVLRRARRLQRKLTGALS